MLITVDDMNYNSPGCFGNPMPGITPNLDNLASKGVRFNNAHVTIAVCQPSRSVLLTGSYPHHNGARGFQAIDAGVTTLPQVLHRNGYYNGIIGKENHCAPKEKFFWDAYIQTLFRDGDGDGKGREPDVYYKQVKKCIQDADDQNKPFFLMVNSHDPHRPFAGSDDELRLFGMHCQIPKTFDPDEVYVPECLPDLPDIRKELAQYYASCHRADLCIGRVLAALEESGHADNTVVLFLSDNGMALPFAKTNCYLNSTKSPYIMRWPGYIKSGMVCDELINGIDYTPTILDILGLEPILDCDGKSFKNVVLAGQKHYDDIFTLFFQTANNAVTKRPLDFPMRCVQDKRFAYIFNAWSDGETEFLSDSRAGLTYNAMEEAAKRDDSVRKRKEFYQYRITEEFYDYRDDPDALNNLIDKPEYYNFIEKFRKRMFKYMEQSRDGLIDEFHRRILSN